MDKVRIRSSNLYWLVQCNGQTQDGPTRAWKRTTAVSELVARATAVVKAVDMGLLYASTHVCVAVEP